MQVHCVGGLCDSLVDQVQLVVHYIHVRLDGTFNHVFGFLVHWTNVYGSVEQETHLEIDTMWFSCFNFSSVHYLHGKEFTR